MKVVDTDRGAARLTRQIEDLARLSPAVTVGVHAEEGEQVHPSRGVTVAEVAAFAEFGTPTEPARSFVRATVDAMQGEIGSDLAAAAEAVARGARVEDAFGAVGSRVLDAMIEQMGDVEPLDEDTVDSRGGGDATPLVETGTLRSALASRVST